MAAELHGAAGTGARIEYPFKGAQDCDALQFLIEHSDVVDNYEFPLPGTMAHTV